MQIPRKWIIILSICTFLLLCLNVFFVFFFDAPAKRPDDTGTDLTDEYQDMVDNMQITDDGNKHTKIDEDAEDNPIIKSENNESNNEGKKDNQAENDQNTLASDDIGLAEEFDIYVRDIPLALNIEMENHLAEFRKKAKQLQQSYPESYLIAMPTTEKVVALTFDDGPDRSSTLKVIEILNTYQVPGTFFFVGRQVDQYAETVKTALKDGHVIANHSWSHIRPTEVNIDLLMDEVQKTQSSISKYGAEVKLFRPPYGLVNEEQMPALIQAGYKTIAWSIDSMDWYFDNPEDIATCVTKNIHPGAIVLMHSSGGPTNRQATIEALPIIIETLQAQGYRFVSLP